VWHARHFCTLCGMRDIFKSHGGMRVIFTSCCGMRVISKDFGGIPDVCRNNNHSRAKEPLRPGPSLQEVRLRSRVGLGTPTTFLYHFYRELATRSKIQIGGCLRKLLIASTSASTGYVRVRDTQRLRRTAKEGCRNLGGTGRDRDSIALKSQMKSLPDPFR
jgi:hypothetical protein